MRFDVLAAPPAFRGSNFPGMTNLTPEELKPNPSFVEAPETGAGCVKAPEPAAGPPLTPSATQAPPRFALWDWLSFERAALLAAAIFAALSVGVGVYFGLYPRPPVEAPLDPDTLYRDGVALGRVLAFNVEQVLVGQFVFQVEASKPIEKGDVLRFRHATCFVVDLGQQPRRLPSGMFFFNGISCRVVGG